MKEEVDLSGLKIDFRQEEEAAKKRLCELQEQAAREKLALQRLKNGSIKEKLSALDSLTPRKSLGIDSLLALKRIRDELSGQEGMEDVVAYIDHAHPKH
jgi:hypothetical protein